MPCRFEQDPAEGRRQVIRRGKTARQLAVEPVKSHVFMPAYPRRHELPEGPAGRVSEVYRAAKAPRPRSLDCCHLPSCQRSQFKFLGHVSVHRSAGLPPAANSRRQVHGRRAGLQAQPVARERVTCVGNQLRAWRTTRPCQVSSGLLLAQANEVRTTGRRGWDASSASPPTSHE